MLALTSPDVPLRRDVLQAPGGFAWWYADLVDDGGDGLVLIGAWGLPFLPGYADGARRGAAERPGDRPSLNLALYRAGKPCFYLLQEGRGAWESDTRWRFGESVLESVVIAGERRLVATLDCPVSGMAERLRGTITVAGPARRPGPRERGAVERVAGGGAGERAPVEPAAIERAPVQRAGAECAAGERVAADGADHAHRWTPLTALARGTADLSVGDWRFAMSGRAYHDRNACGVPLDHLGIGEWLWGRAPLGDREVVWYLLWPKDGGPVAAWGLAIGPDGSTMPVEGLSVALGARRRSVYGLTWWDRVTLSVAERPWIAVTHGPAVEDGPFYLRFLPTVEGGGDRARGVAELVRPDRVDVPWMRPFVRMRVRPGGGRGSVWLPLFEGPAEGRAGRLLAGWLGG